MDLFKLVSVYEVILKDSQIGRPVRVEIFQSLKDVQIYRPRIWVRNTYNAYPAAVNTGPRGENLNNLHSSDDFNIDISTLVAEEESFFIGKKYEYEEQVLEYALSRVKIFYGEEFEDE